MNRNHVITTLGSIAMLFVSASAYAELSPQDAAGNGILDTVVGMYARGAAGWEPILRPAAERLFWALTAIGMIWRFGRLVFTKGDIGDFFGALIPFVVITGLNWWLLQNGPMIAGDIIDSLMELGSQAIGSEPVTPSSIVGYGFMVWARAIAFWKIHWVDGIAGVVVSLGILMFLAAIAVNVMLNMIFATVSTYAGFFMLGFGGAEWTSDVVWRYFRRAFNYGFRLLVLMLLLGAGVTALDQFYRQLSSSLSLEELGVMLVYTFALWLLTTKAPAEIANMIGDHGGGAGISPGDVARTAASAASAAVGAAVGTAGGASAIIAAVKEGQAHTAAGTDIMSRLTGGNADDGGSGSGSSGAGDSMSLGQAMGIDSSSSSSSGGSSRGGSSGSGAGQSGSTSGSSRASTGAGSSTASAGAGQGSDGATVKGTGGQGSSSAGGGGRTSGGQGTLLGMATNTGKVAVDAAANLAAGVMDRAIAGTTGGQIAAQIRARGEAGRAEQQRQGQDQDQGAPVFGGDSITAANTNDWSAVDIARGWQQRPAADESATPPMADEVAAFVEGRASE